MNLTKGVYLKRFYLIFGKLQEPQLPQVPEVKTEVKDDSFSIYSHDNNVYVKINTDKPISGIISIFNLTGQLILDYQIKNEYNITIPLTNPSGLYNVRVVSNGETKTAKVFIK